MTTSTRPEPAGAEDAAVARGVSQLLEEGDSSRERAAFQLARLGVQSRGSVRPRGTLTRAAPTRLPEPLGLSPVLKLLDDANPAVRGPVAGALGEWGDGAAAAELARRLGIESRPEVQLEYVAALQTLGGPEAAGALSQAAHEGSDTVADAALAALEELVTGGPEDATETASPIQLETRLRESLTTDDDAELVLQVTAAVRTLTDAPAGLRHRRLRASSLLQTLEVWEKEALVLQAEELLLRSPAIRVAGPGTAFEPRPHPVVQPDRAEGPTAQ